MRLEKLQRAAQRKLFRGATPQSKKMTPLRLPLISETLKEAAIPQ